MSSSKSRSRQKKPKIGDGGKGMKEKEEEEVNDAKERQLQECEHIINASSAQNSAVRAKHIPQEFRYRPIWVDANFTFISTERKFTTMSSKCDQLVDPTRQGANRRKLAMENMLKNIAALPFIH